MWRVCFDRIQRVREMHKVRASHRPEKEAKKEARNDRKPRLASQKVRFVDYARCWLVCVRVCALLLYLAALYSPANQGHVLYERRRKGGRFLYAKLERRGRRGILGERTCLLVIHKGLESRSRSRIRRMSKKKRRREEVGEEEEEERLRSFFSKLGYISVHEHACEVPSHIDPSGGRRRWRA